MLSIPTTKLNVKKQMDVILHVKYRFSDLINNNNKKEPTVCCLKEIHFKCNM